MLYQCYYFIALVIILQIHHFGCSDLKKLEDAEPLVSLDWDVGLDSDEIDVVWDKDPVPNVNAIYFFDQMAVKVLLEFVQNPGNAKILFPNHLQLINKYVYEWFDLIQEPISENPNKWNDHLLIFNNHIPKSLGFQDIVMRNIIRIQLNLQRILEYSNDIIWKEQVVDKISEAEALTGIDIHRLEDLEESSASLALLTKTYNLHPFELYPQTINKESSFMDFIHAAIHASSSPLLLSLALEWFEAAKSLLKDDVISVWQDILSQNENLPKSLQTEENYWLKLKTNRENYEREKEDFVKQERVKLERIFFREENSEDHKDSESMKTKLIRDKTEHIYLDLLINAIINSTGILSNQTSKKEKETNLRTFPKGVEDEDLKIMQKKLCRGIDSKSTKEMSMYSCHLDSRNSPYLLLMPVKVEELNQDPEVMILHHIVGDKKIHEFQQLALPIAKSAEVGGESSDIPGMLNMTLRNSHTAWLDEFTSENARRLNQLIGHLTGYSVSEEIGGVESLQVNSYLAGGFYHSHRDSFELFRETFPGKSDKEVIDLLMKVHPNGNRIATFMLYMNDDMIGGRTVFPHLRLSVAPEKRSAIYWTNLHLNGSAHEHSLHAGCQVLAGTKWVANKWIASNAQMFRKPCALEKEL